MLKTKRFSLRCSFSLQDISRSVNSFGKNIVLFSLILATDMIYYYLIHSKCPSRPLSTCSSHSNFMSPTSWCTVFIFLISSSIVTFSLNMSWFLPLSIKFLCFHKPSMASKYLLYLSRQYGCFSIILWWLLIYVKGNFLAIIGYLLFCLAWFISWVRKEPQSPWRISLQGFLHHPSI